MIVVRAGNVYGKAVVRLLAAASDPLTLAASPKIPGPTQSENKVFPAPLHVLWKENSMRPLTTSVTALRFVTLSAEDTNEAVDTLFAAIGNQLHVFLNKSGKAVAATTALPDGERLHGFSAPWRNRVIVHGGRFVAIVSARFLIGSCTGSLEIEACREFGDWVWGGLWIQPPHVLAVACGHSRVAICDSRNLQDSLVVQCEEREITWCTQLFMSPGKSALRAVGGTSFGDILVWDVLDQVAEPQFSLRSHEENDADDRFSLAANVKPAHRLQGHDGPVMSLELSSDASRMVSCSVDRSVRVWRRSASDHCSVCRAGGCFLPVLCHYGHLARIWDTGFLDCESLRVVSVGEDRTCRMWSDKESGRLLSVLYGHAGRNIWSLDVRHVNQRSTLIATGGEDGCIKVRSVGIPDDDKGSPGETRTVNDTGTPRQSTSYSVVLPGNLSNPRKIGGGCNESGRTIRLIARNAFLVSTDFGRILAGFTDRKGSSRRNVSTERTFDKATGIGVSWIELFCDSKGTAYTPSSLEYCDGLIFGGQTNGHVTILRISDLFSQAPVISTAADVHVFPHDSGMVMGLFVQKSSASDVWNFFAATNTGDLHHWQIEEPRSEITCTYHRTFRQRKPTKSALVTSALHIASHDILVVGDRGGRVLLYNTTDAKSSDTNGINSQMDQKDVFPVFISRPHGDRVSSISMAPGQTPDANMRFCEIVTTGFDGRVGRLQLDLHAVQTKKLPQNNPGACQLPMNVISSHKSIEHVDTIVRIVFPRMSSPEEGEVSVKGGEDVRHCIIGFKSADISVWDVQQRNEVFRTNCGNWRRAFDVHVALACPVMSGSGTQLVVEEMNIVFWRSGRLYVVQTEGGNADMLRVNNAENWTADKMKSKGSSARIDTFVTSIRPGFHGQRANAVCWIDGSSTLLTASEDTSINAMKLRDDEWHKIQSLSRHISGVNSLSTSRLSNGSLVTFSGGGCDEVVTWIAQSAEGPWRDVCSTAGSAKEDKGQRALHRVICLSTVDAKRCKCKVACGMVVAGRSDGSVALLRSAPAVGGMYRQAGKEWNCGTVQKSFEHSGAVLSCATAVAEVGGEERVIAASGDSQGRVVVWTGELNPACLQRRLKAICTWEKEHDGGVNAIAVRAMKNGMYGSVVVVSGGDDEKVRIRVIRITGTVDGERADVRTETTTVWTSPRGLHTAAVTGLSFATDEASKEGAEDEWFVATTGADQRINWVHIYRGRDEANKGVWLANLVEEGRSRVNVADVGAIAARVSRSGRRVCAQAVIAGCGLEAVDCSWQVKAEDRG